MNPNYGLRLALVAAAWMTLTEVRPVWAGYSVEISVDGGPPLILVDDSPQDLNDTDFDMEFDFTVGDAGNNWTASGKIFATGGGNGAPPVATIVTDTLIEKLQPGLIPGQIRVIHNYAASGLGSHLSILDGQFENTLGGPISFANLNFVARVNNILVGSTGVGPAMGLGPVPFFDVLGPLELPTTTEHEFQFDFYLDAPGDAIRLFDSAELHTSIPEPRSLVLAALAAIALTRRQRLVGLPGPTGQGR